MNSDLKSVDLDTRNDCREKKQSSYCRLTSRFTTKSPTHTPSKQGPSRSSSTGDARRAPATTTAGSPRVRTPQYGLLHIKQTLVKPLAKSSAPSEARNLWLSATSPPPSGWTASQLPATPRACPSCRTRFAFFTSPASALHSVLRHMASSRSSSTSPGADVPCSMSTHLSIQNMISRRYGIVILFLY